MLLVCGEGGPPRGPSAVLFPEKDWSLVALGPYGMVLLKREAKNEAVVAKFGYAVLRPDDLPYLVWAVSRGTVSRPALQGDLRRASDGSLPSELAVALQSTSRQLEAQERGTHAP